MSLRSAAHTLFCFTDGKGNFMKRMTWKRRSLALALSAALLLCVTGCSSTSQTQTQSTVSTTSGGTLSSLLAEIENGGKDKSVTVMIYGQTHEMEIYDSMLEDFEDENPDVGTVEIQQSQQTDYSTQVTSALASGTMADVFYIEPANVARYAEQGQILALDDLLDEDQMASIQDIWPDAVSAFRYDSATEEFGTGSLYALPHDYSAFMLAYNKNLFDAKGVAYPDDDNPMTWDEFRNICAQLVTEDPSNPTWGCAIPFEFFFPQILYSNGGHFLSDDLKTVEFVYGDGSYQQPFLDSLNFLKGLVQDGLAPTPADDAALAVYQRWVSGQIGFYPCGTWDVANFNDPELVAFDDWGLTYYPVGPSGTYTAARAGTVGYAVYSGSDNVDGAVKFIEYFATNLEGQQQLAEGGIQLPNLMSYATGEFASELESGVIQYADNYQVVFNYMGGESSGTAPNGYGYRNVMPEYFYTPTTLWWNGSNGFLTQATAFMEGSISAEDYMSSMQTACQEELDTAWEEFDLAGSN